jgi:hypothetical protein
MDMTELNRAASAPVNDEAAAMNSNASWLALVGDLSAEIAGPLTTALERVHLLASTGRIDRAGLRALGEELQRARQVSMSGQQLARLASGELRQTPERLPLTDTLKDVLGQRADEAVARNIHIKQVLRPTEVIVDASLLYTLFDTLVDWSMAHAQSTLELRVDIKTWPTNARLNCKFAHRPVDQVVDEATAESQARRLDSITWRLLEQTARTMGLLVERKIEGAHVSLTIEFPRTVNDQIEGVTAIELDDGFAPSSYNSKPLAGSHILVVASRRDVRVQVRDAIRNMGLLVDFVNSVDEAREFCRGGLPHAIVIESALRGDRFNELRAEVENDGADVVFVEIIEEGNSFEISGFGGLNMARVGRDAILSSLPSALLFELSKTA